MALSDLNVVGFLKGRMKWHQARQRVLADNVANADTPFYKPHDLKEVPFEELIKTNKASPFTTATTHRAHFEDGIITGRGPFSSRDGVGFEVRPAGNAVVLEEQMMKVQQNQFDYRMASTMYSKSIGLIKTAIGRGA